MVHLLEAHGVRVFSLVEECHEIDAYSLWDEGTPYVFFNTEKSAEHGRFDAAHELGHLVLHHDPVACLGDRKAEQDAQRFAGAFLMPERSVKATAPWHGALPDLIAAKGIWKVSLSGLVYRMHELGMLTDWEYRSLFVNMSARGYLKQEPGAGRRETSRVLAKVIDLLREQALTTADIAVDLNISREILNKLLFGLTLTAVDGHFSGPEPGAAMSIRLAD
jgi:Zn-dependent peptidase ImmA (M78 family)